MSGCDLLRCSVARARRSALGAVRWKRLHVDARLAVVLKIPVVGDVEGSIARFCIVLDPVVGVVMEEMSEHCLAVSRILGGIQDVEMPELVDGQTRHVVLTGRIRCIAMEEAFVPHLRLVGLRS